MSSDRIIVHPVHPDPRVRAEVVAQAYRRGFRRFAISERDSLPDGVERVTVTDTEYRSPDGARLLRRDVENAAALADAIREAKSTGGVALRWTSDRVIPLENTIAHHRGSFRLWTTTSRPEEVPGLLGALEHGADAVVVELRTPEEVDRLEALLDARARPPVAWTLGRVVRVTPVGLSDRVLLDTTSLLTESEGVLVGSRAAALFHLRSEALGSAHSRPRRFRVNAGAPHSYVLMADGSTRYLSELEPGEELLAVDRTGTTRGVRLGRLKIERRPTVLLEASVGPARATVFVQEAETVRLSGVSGALSVTSLSVGTDVLVAVLPPGRHLGHAIDETIEER
ncbi:MAG: 3-dehydroquinate synthase II [Thermoplasmata archaeon]|nr:3-dehydroquinate synthase II [Thermoplasmata archaeon]